MNWPTITPDARMPKGEAYLLSTVCKPNGEVSVSAVHLRNIGQAKS